MNLHSYVSLPEGIFVGNSQHRIFCTTSTSQPKSSCQCYPCFMLLRLHREGLIMYPKCSGMILIMVCMIHDLGVNHTIEGDESKLCLSLCVISPSRLREVIRGALQVQGVLVVAHHGVHLAGHQRMSDCRCEADVHLKFGEIQGQITINYGDVGQQSSN